MKLEIIYYTSFLIAAILVMIIHEVPKALVFRKVNKEKKEWKIFCLNRYIDPIGLLFFILFGAGFSKPYMYRMKDKKTNFLLGLLGGGTLLFIFMISVILLRNLGVSKELTYNIYEPTGKIFLKFLLAFISRFSINMFLVNLFPTSTFNMGLIIAGKSPFTFFKIVTREHIIKVILFFLLLSGHITALGDLILIQLL